jgi:nucleotide-binding universal stress UspA family protein
VDGSEPSRDALRWAVEEAQLRGARLRALHAWWAYPMGGAGGPPDHVAERLGGDARSAVEAFVTETVGEENIDVEVVTVQGRHASAALVDAAAEADLLVVGSRGAGGFSGLLLGSVSQQCAYHAPCPVVIVRRRESDAKQP